VLELTKVVAIEREQKKDAFDIVKGLRNDLAMGKETIGELRE